MCEVLLISSDLRKSSSFSFIKVTFRFFFPLPEVAMAKASELVQIVTMAYDFKEDIPPLCSSLAYPKDLNIYKKKFILNSKFSI